MSRHPWQPALSPNAWLRWEAVRQLIPPDARSVLEVGCGRGGFGVRLAEGRRYVGVEPDAASAEVARVRLREHRADGEVRVGDVSVVDPAEDFDLVCAFEVIEHVEEDGAFVRECARRVRPGGTLLLTTPAGESRFGIADEMVGHFRRYERGRLERLIADAGLQPVLIEHYGAPFAYVLEGVRTGIARTLQRRTRAQSAAERTAVSGRLMQPGDGVIAPVVWAGMLAPRLLQRAAPRRGPSLVAVARRPASSST
jgi:SAM-dependent methyltransferase